MIEKIKYNIKCREIYVMLYDEYKLLIKKNDTSDKWGFV